MLDQIRNVLRFWDIEAKCLRPEIFIAGSPERTDYRVVVETVKGALLVVEKVSPRLLEHKQRIAQALQFLKAQKLSPITPYLDSSQGLFLVKAEDFFWQVVPFVVGVELNRPEYIFDDWRGIVAGEFLTALHFASQGIPFFKSTDSFSLPAYIDELMGVIRKRRRDVVSQIDAIYSYVQKYLYPVYIDLPTGFCHGDYHPVNIIWQDKAMAAVIDWEFLGYKPELYDAANMLSCLGIEDPEGLKNGAAVHFVHTLKGAGVYSDISFQHLLDLVIAVRFAWLSEWLRKKDNDMIEMEFDYFHILSSSRKEIETAWGI
ncbi:MAG: aminoglycoside phosphotransferase family protein [Candidatus Omnitrophica bacterium]|nr:aminoglycoside phosphotransferase family protein [Candidatus Omnitrophota bacterium]